MAHFSGHGRRTTAPWPLASAPSHSRPQLGESVLQALASDTWGRPTMPAATSAGGRAAAAERGGGGRGACARPGHPAGSCSRAWLGAYLERARGTSPRAGATGRRRSASPEAVGSHRSLPTAASATWTSAKATWSRPSRGSNGPGPLSCLRQPDLVLRLIAAGLGYAYALQGRVAEGRALLEEALETGNGTGGLRSGARSLAQRGLSLAGRGQEAAARPPGAGPGPCSTRNAGNEAHALHRLAYPAHGTPPMSRRPKPTTSRPSPWPTNSACARSWPTATVASAPSTPRLASENKPVPNSPRPSTSTAPWT